MPIEDLGPSGVSLNGFDLPKNRLAEYVRQHDHHAEPDRGAGVRSAHAAFPHDAFDELDRATRTTHDEVEQPSYGHHRDRRGPSANAPKARLERVGRAVS